MNGQVRNYVNFWELLAGRGIQGSGAGISIGSAVSGGGGSVAPGPGFGSPGSGSDGFGLNNLSGLANFAASDDTVGNNVSAKYVPTLAAGIVTVGYLTASGLPITADTIIDILFNPLGLPGLGWWSIFPPPMSGPLLISGQTPAQRLALSPNYPVFPVLNPASQNIFPISIAGDPVFLRAGGILRMDVLQTGGAKDLLAVIGWAPKRIALTAGQANFTQPGNSIIPMLQP